MPLISRRTNQNVWRGQPGWQALTRMRALACRFFPTAVYLSTSKLAVAAVGNLSFAMALCMYNLVIKVC